MNLKKIKQYAFIGLFVGGVSLAFPVFNVFSKQLSLDNHENRLLTTLPDVLASPLGKLPDALNTFLADNSPFRYQLVIANANLNYDVFHTVESDQVLMGKNDWLFFKDGPNAATPVANYQGLVRMNQDQLAQLAQNLQSLADAYAARGGQLVVSFAPSKDLIYREYMPEDYPVLTEVDLTRQVADYLADNTSLEISYVPEKLLEIKSQTSMPLFFKTDTHWNHAGALAALDDVLQRIGGETQRFVDYDFHVNGTQSGDLANVSALYTRLEADPDYYPTNYSPVRDRRSVIVYGDSFSEYYMPYLTSQFDNAWRDALANLDRNTLPDCGADIVIIEANERSFETLCEVLQPH